MPVWCLSPASLPGSWTQRISCIASACCTHWRGWYLNSSCLALSSLPPVSISGVCWQSVASRQYTNCTSQALLQYQLCKSYFLMLSSMEVWLCSLLLPEINLTWDLYLWSKFMIEQTELHNARFRWYRRWQAWEAIWRSATDRIVGWYKAHSSNMIHEPYRGGK